MSMLQYIEGRLTYNSTNRMYGMVSIGFDPKTGFIDVWECDGFHPEDYLEVWMDNQWLPTYMNIDRDGEWYLMCTPYVGDLEAVPVRILRRYRKGAGI